MESSALSQSANHAIIRDAAGLVTSQWTSLNEPMEGTAEGIPLLLCSLLQLRDSRPIRMVFLCRIGGHAVPEALVVNIVA